MLMQSITPSAVKRLEELAAYLYMHRAGTKFETPLIDVLAEVIHDYRSGAITNELLEYLLDGYESRKEN